MIYRSLLRLEDKLAAEDVHLRALGRGHHPSRFAAAIVLALVAHAAVLLVPAPSASGALPLPSPPRASAFSTVVRWIPAPPPRAVPSTAPAMVTLPMLPPPPAPADAGFVGMSAAEMTADLDAFRRTEPVPEPLPRVAVTLPRGVDTLIGYPTPAPSPVKPMPSAAPVLTRPVVVIGGRVDPEYPPAARALRLTGSVRLEVEVRDDGTVGTVTVVSVSRRGVGFEAAAIAAVRQWRFVPGTEDGRPASSTTSVEITFQ